MIAELIKKKIAIAERHGLMNLDALSGLSETMQYFMLHISLVTQQNVKQLRDEYDRENNARIRKDLEVTFKIPQWELDPVAWREVKNGNKHSKREADTIFSSNG